MNCVLCRPQTNNEVMLTNLINGFKTILEKLESHINLELKNQKQKQNELQQMLDRERNKNKFLEDELKNTRDNSDLYHRAKKNIGALHKENNLKFHQESEEKTEGKKNDSVCPLFVRKEVSPVNTPHILAQDTCPVAFISSDEEDFIKETKRKSPKRTPKTFPSGSGLKTCSPKPIRDSFFLKPLLPSNKKLQSSSEVDLDETRLDCEGKLDSFLCDGENESLLQDTSDCDIFESCPDWDSLPSSPILSACKDKRLRSSGQASTLDQSMEQGDDGKSTSLLKKNHPFFNRFAVKPVKKKSYEELGDNPLLDSLPLHCKSRGSGSSSSIKNSVRKSGTLLLPQNTSLDELFDKTDGDLETTTMLNIENVNDDSDEWDNDKDFEAYMTVCDENSQPKHFDMSGSKDKQQGLNEKEIPKMTLMELQDSFDIVPPETDDKPKFKYQEVVRKQSERRKLDGKACEQCEAFYEDIPEEERSNVLRDVCRHKHVYAPPSTPEHFWEIQFPSTAECKKRGYIVEQDSMIGKEPRRRRKKPFQAHFKTKD